MGPRRPNFQRAAGRARPDVSHLLMRRGRPDSLHTNGWHVPAVRPVQRLNTYELPMRGCRNVRARARTRAERKCSFSRASSLRPL